MKPWAGHSIVPLATLHGPQEADAAAEGLIAGGMPIVEVALRSEYGMAAISRLAARGDITVGAGTVLDLEQAEQVIEAGASFVVTPGFDEAIIDFLHSRSVPVLPGVLTPTEVQKARRYGLTDLKLFPANAVDAIALLSGYTSVYPDLRFMPSGGVGLDNLATYLQHPAVFAISGSWLLKDLSDAGASVKARAEEAREQAGS